MVYEEAKCADDVDYNCRIVVAPPRVRAVFQTSVLTKSGRKKREKIVSGKQHQMLSVWLQSLWVRVVGSGRRSLQKVPDRFTTMTKGFGSLEDSRVSCDSGLKH